MESILYGRTGKLVAELEALMRRQGIDIRLDTDIEEILVQGERVIGARTRWHRNSRRPNYL